MQNKYQSIQLTVYLFLLAISLVGCRGPQTACDQPLDEEVLNGLMISPEQDAGVRPGDQLQLELAVVECCTFYQTINACATWVLGSGEGAQITPDGELTIGSDAAHGERLEVIANIEEGRRIVKRTIEIYREADNPLVGTWEEVSQISCETGDYVDPMTNIEEVIFKADGSFVITKQPFELYFDYAGTYSYQLPENTIVLVEDKANRSPSDFDGQGFFQFDDEGALILQEIWLGLPDEAVPRTRCGHRLVRQ